MMVGLPIPYECDGFENLTQFEQAKELATFESYLERLLNDVKERKAIALKAAYDSGDFDDGTLYVQVRYKEGKSFAPDASLLEQNFPDKHRAWILAEQEKFKPKLTKTAFERLWTTEGHTRAEKKASKEKNLAEMQTCMVEHPVNTQYILASVAEREAWKAAHPIEEEADA